MKTKPKDIITEDQLKKWLGLSDYQLSVIRPKLPKYTLTRELRLYNRQRIVEFLDGFPSVDPESGIPYY